MWALWCAGCVRDRAWRAGLSQQEPNKAWVREEGLKLLHLAWDRQPLSGPSLHVSGLARG